MHEINIRKAQLRVCVCVWRSGTFGNQPVMGDMPEAQWDPKGQATGRDLQGTGFLFSDSWSFPEHPLDIQHFFCLVYFYIGCNRATRELTYEYRRSGNLNKLTVQCE